MGPVALSAGPLLLGARRIETTTVTGGSVEVRAEIGAERYPGVTAQRTLYGLVSVSD